MKLHHRVLPVWPAALTLLCILVFLLWPDLDRQISERFHLGEQAFWADGSGFANLLYEGVPRLGQLCFVLVLCGFLAHWSGLRRFSRKTLRAWMAWLLVVVLGVGLVVHTGLKNSIGRPRPVETTTMGGQAVYVPPFVQSDACRENCSFVSGHAAIAFSLMAWGAMARRRLRHRWVLAGCVAGLTMGAVRMLQGRHFLSDVVFAGWAVWWVQWSIHRCWTLWIARRRAGLALGASASGR